ncbi:hypothetical protein DQ195_11990, partial [Enterococcus faecium]|nr:hypothetical protein [Enterococcus faecium]
FIFRLEKISSCFFHFTIIEKLNFIAKKIINTYKYPLFILQFLCIFFLLEKGILLDNFVISGKLHCNNDNKCTIITL